MKMKRNNKFELRTVAGQGMIIPLESLDCNALMTLNDTGVFLWNQMAESVTSDELAELLCKEYEVSADVAKRDVDLFLSKLESAGLLDE